MNDLPGIDLNIEAQDGKSFFFTSRNAVIPMARGEQRRNIRRHCWRRARRQDPMFEVEHHKCHGCAELGPNAKFRMELVGPNEARLWNLLYEGAGKDPGPGMKLVLHALLSTNSLRPQRAPN
jgi:hypothetical protein